MISEPLKPYTPETHQNIGKFLDLTALTSEQKQNLRKRIEENDGTIIAFIHPYFKTDDNNFMMTDVTGDTEPKRMREGLESLLRVQKNGPPIFMFEESNHDKKIENILGQISQKDSYIVTTKESDPEPTVGWTNMIAFMKQLGIKTIVIGGMYLTIKTEDNNLGPRGCVAGAIEELRDNFKIRISQFTYPNKNMDYFEWEGRV